MNRCTGCAAYLREHSVVFLDERPPRIIMELVWRRKPNPERMVRLVMRHGELAARTLGHLRDC